MPDILHANKIAWDHEIEKGRDSCIPVSVSMFLIPWDGVDA